MKLALFILSSATLVGAELTESTIEWRPACDGASIEIVTEGAQIRAVHACAFHHALICEWSIHYLNGVATTAEYRERTRGRIKEGENAGELSGDNPLTKLLTFAAVEGRFTIGDPELAQDLAELLLKVERRE